MIIELIGCTSAGKTTLAGKLVEAGKKRNVPVFQSDFFILKKMRLDRIENAFIRRRVVELAGILFWLMQYREFRSFSKAAMQACLQARGSLLYRMHLARIVLKKAGIRAFLNRYAPGTTLIIVDNEGLMQAPHNLFVHDGGEFERDAELKRLAAATPMPDVTIYVEQPASVLIDRIAARGHNRLDDLSKANIARFVKQAIHVFEGLLRVPSVNAKCLIFSDESVSPACDSMTGQPLMLLKSLLEEIQLPASSPTGLSNSFLIEKVRP